MCEVCDRLVNVKMGEINKNYIEETIYEQDMMGEYRKFMMSKYNNGGFTLDYESDNESCSMEIKYCPFCGNKLE